MLELAFFLLLALLVTAIVMSVIALRRTRHVCPHCRGARHPQARVCPHCGRE